MLHVPRSGWLNLNVNYAIAGWARQNDETPNFSTFNQRWKLFSIIFASAAEQEDQSIIWLTFWYISPRYFEHPMYFPTPCWFNLKSFQMCYHKNTENKIIWLSRFWTFLIPDAVFSLHVKSLSCANTLWKFPRKYIFNSQGKTFKIHKKIHFKFTRKCMSNSHVNIFQIHKGMHFKSHVNTFQINKEMHFTFTWKYMSKLQGNTIQIHKEMHFKFTSKYISNSHGNASQIHKEIHFKITKKIRLEI